MVTDSNFPKLQPEQVEPAERRQISAAEAALRRAEHVEVFQLSV